MFILIHVVGTFLTHGNAKRDGGILMSRSYINFYHVINNYRNTCTRTELKINGHFAKFMA